LIAIVSDSHDNTGVVKKAVKLLKQLSPSLVIHCGDVMSPSTLELFEDLPLKLVFGNCDYDPDALCECALRLGLATPQHSLELDIEGKRAFITHGDNAALISHVLASQSFDYLFHGHLHEQRDERDGRTRIINPGALYRAEAFSIATLDIARDMLEFHEVI
jgi:uncharacterized protein